MVNTETGEKIRKEVVDEFHFDSDTDILDVSSDSSSDEENFESHADASGRQMTRSAELESDSTSEKFLSQQEITDDDCYIRIKEKLSLWPRSEGIAKCEVVPVAKEGTVYIVEEMVRAQYSVESSIVIVRNGEVRIPVRNLGNAPLEITKGTKLSFARDSDDDYVIRVARMLEKDREDEQLLRIDEEKELKGLKKEFKEVLKKTSHVTKKESEMLLKCLLRNKDVISVRGENLGFTKAYQFEVKLMDGTRPINVPPYRIPQSQQKLVDEHVKDMLEKDVIEPSNSPWSAPVLLVKKKDGTLRFCVDYRRLNAVTIPDRFPIPLMQDIVNSLGKAKYFTSLDLLSGYWQMSVDENSKAMTAFSTHSGHYQFKRLPFGVRNGPACFSRLMNNVLTGLTGKDAYVYLDDIIIFSNTVEEHIMKLERVFDRLRKFNLKLKLTKCSFLQSEIAYLGYRITSNGVKPDPEKIQSLKTYPVPKNFRLACLF